MRKGGVFSTKYAVLQKYMFKLLLEDEETNVFFTKDSSFTQREVDISADVDVKFVFVWFVLTELRLVVLGQASAACTMLGLQEKQDGKSAPAKYTREAAGKKAIDSLSHPEI